MSRLHRHGLVACTALGVLAGTLAASRSARAQEFSYAPPGELVPGSGTGRKDDKVYAPTMRFPIESGPAFANSQVWGVGGSEGPAGGQCDEANFSYPWHDNYCETRSWDMPLCPSGTGHQGQDIRAATCDKNVHWAIAVEDGTVTNVGSYSVYITTADGTRFDYLHMGSVQVAVGDTVKKGDHVGKVSNEFGGTSTTVHLHFNIRQNVDGVGTVYVPTYMSLITAYQTLIGPVDGPPRGALDGADCTSVRGWAQDPGTPDQPLAVELAFGGAKGDAAATVIQLTADRVRDDLCGSIGSCAHGFETALPLSVLGGEHPVNAYAKDTGDGDEALLDGSPRTLSCALELPEGQRRPVAEGAFQAWKFSDFWDVARGDADALDGVPEAPALGNAPVLVRADDGSPEVWLVDGEVRRHVGSPELAAAWSFDLGAVEERPAAVLAGMDEGPPVRARPFLVRMPDDALWLLDTPLDWDGAAGVGGGFWGSSSGSDGDSAAEGSSGCACRSGAATSSAAGGWLLLAAFGVALGRARRRKR
jgi:MYXO-CTERM domain-containing protein